MRRAIYTHRLQGIGPVSGPRVFYFMLHTSAIVSNNDDAYI